jgi:murein DD-endopeptidase MepM/ murein hydrolase activator NlpD
MGWAAQSAAQPISLRHQAEVGDGTAFPVTVTGAGLASVTLTFLQRSVTANSGEAERGEPEFLVLLPVPLDRESGSSEIRWSARLADGSTASGSSTVKIVKRVYPVQKLTVAPKYVTPDPALKERIEEERNRMNAALTARSDARRWTLPMARPVPGAITSLYGLRRVLNGQPRNAHKGLDFRGAEGSPIAAVADGTVVLTGDFYYAGKFVAVDHGLGVVSVSMHMSEVIARRGQAVKTGDILGLVGSTGRSTGPHLHLGLSVLGLSIDALPLMDLIDEDKAVYAAAMQKASDSPRKKAAKRADGGGKKKNGSAPITKNTKKADQNIAGKAAASPRTGTGDARSEQETR